MRLRTKESLLISLIGGAAAIMLLAISSHSIEVNADSFAYVRLARSLASGVSIFDHKFARIPSLFPDLVILTPIAKAGDFTTRYIYSVYGLASIFLLIMTSSEYVFRCGLSQSPRRLNSCLLVTICMIALARYSPIYREAVGIYMTPVHHGGNVFNTILFGVLCLRSFRVSERRSRRVHIALLGTVCVVGVFSNSLFLITAILPYLLIIYFKVFTRRFRAQTIKLNRYFFAFCALYVTAISILVMASRSWLFLLQCNPALNIDMARTLSLVQSYLYKYPNTLSALFASVLCLVLLWRTRVSDSIRRSSIDSRESSSRSEYMSIGVSYLLLSSVSWLLYIPLLSNSDYIEKRYMLIGILWLPIAIVLLARTLVRMRSCIQLQTTTYCIFVWALLVGFVMTKEGIPKILRSLDGGFVAERVNTYQHAARALEKNNLHYGFSLFWDVELDILKDGSLALMPVLQNGLPDLWTYSHVIFENLLSRIENEKGPIFFFSSSGQIPKGITDSWGIPSRIIQGVNEVSLTTQAGKDFTIYVYEDLSSVRGILGLMRKKLLDFQQVCDRGSRDFWER